MKEGTFFGTVGVDIETTPHLKEKFSEMTAIFKNLEIKRSDVGEHMQTFAEEHEIMTTPRRTLIGSYHDENISLGKPLVKFYHR